MNTEQSLSDDRLGIPILSGLDLSRQNTDYFDFC